MAIAFISSHSTNTGTPATSHAITISPAPADDELLVWTHATEGNSGGATDFTFPAGWTVDVYKTGAGETVIASKIASSEGTSFTVSQNSGEAVSCIMRFNLNGGTGALDNSNTGDGLTGVAPACTLDAALTAADRDDCVVVWGYSQNDDTNWNVGTARTRSGTATGGGDTEENDFNPSSSTDVGAEQGYEILTAKGTWQLVSAQDTRGGENAVMAAAVYRGSADGGAPAAVIRRSLALTGVGR